jgi:hypothetical protein
MLAVIKNHDHLYLFANFSVQMFDPYNLRETLTYAQPQHLSFEHRHMILKNLNIKELINDN